MTQKNKRKVKKYFFTKKERKDFDEMIVEGEKLLIEIKDFKNKLRRMKDDTKE